MKVSLCPACNECPSVETVMGEEVRIGEDGNSVTLNKEAWNTLVRKIRANELGEL